MLNTNIALHNTKYAIKERGTKNGWLYTLYADGYIEATRQVSVPPGNWSATISTPFTMADTSYKVFLSPGYNYAINPHFGCDETLRTTTTFIVGRDTAGVGSTSDFDTLLRGYIAH